LKDKNVTKVLIDSWPVMLEKSCW